MKWSLSDTGKISQKLCRYYQSGTWGNLAGQRRALSSTQRQHQRQNLINQLVSLLEQRLLGFEFTSHAKITEAPGFIKSFSFLFCCLNHSSMYHTYLLYWILSILNFKNNTLSYLNIYYYELYPVLVLNNERIYIWENE